MTRLYILLIAALSFCGALKAEESSYTISFGSQTASTSSLTNSTFTSAITAGASYVDAVTSVVSVFPETDCIRLSSQKTLGKFNIHLTENAQVVAKRIVVRAARYDNDRDADAAVMLNSETLFVPSTAPEDYVLTIPSRPAKTLTNLIVDADYRLYLYSITVYYDSADGEVDPERQTVATPVFTPAGGSVSRGTAVEITCPTDGATIYYTIDGATPTSSSPVYDSPIVVFNDLTIKAFAVKEGMDASEEASAAFRVHDPGQTLTAEFNFAQPETLTPAVEAPATKESVDLDGRTFTDGDIAVSFAASAGGNTHVRLYGSYDAGCDLRVYDGETVSLRSLNPNIMLDEIYFEMSLSAGSDVDFLPSAGEYDWLTNTWRAPADEAIGQVTLTSQLQSRFTAISVTLRELSGVDSAVTDRDDTAVYYNLQGRRISASTLTPGFYIRVDGRRASKILVR